MNTCLIPGCNKSIKSKGYCSMHYERLRRGQPLIKEIKKCSVEGCQNKYYAMGLCHSHYESKQRKILIMPNKCKGCVHRRPVFKHSRETLCHYCIDTNKLRECSVDNCNCFITNEQLNFGEVIESEDDYEVVKSIAISSRNWTDFRQSINEWCGGDY